jgi:hypothetical protein
MQVFAETNRILKPGGRFFVTVPNAIGCSNVARICRGEQPSSFPPYRPEGINLRHNRELTPYELKTMYTSAGFQIESLKTVNVSTPDFKSIDFRKLGKIFNQFDDLPLRKDFLMALGIKTGKVTNRYPSDHMLYYPWDVERLEKRS